MNKRFALLLLFIGVVFIGFSNSIEELATNEKTKYTDFGVCVIDIASDSVIAQLGSDRYITPASTMKLITSATAKRILGANYRYNTKVYIDGEINNQGILNGFVRIVGSGDPSLGSKEFANQPVFVDLIVSALKGKGIKGINGNVIIDESIFKKASYPLGVNVEDVAENYGAGAFGINFCDNICSFELDLSGKYAKIFNTNPLINIAFENNIVICNSMQENATSMPSLIRGLDSRVINLIGEVKQSNKIKTIYCSNPNPAKFLQDSLIMSIQNNGIEFNTTDVALSNKSEILIDYQSPNLSEILSHLLITSDNMYADCVLRTLAVNAGKKGELSEGITVVKEYWSSKGIDVSGLIMCDGSGLTRRSKMQAKFLAQILVEMHRNENDNIPFHTLLPIAGVNGTVKSLLKDTHYAGKYALKSGSMRQVQCYAGFYPADAPKYAVVVLANFYACSRQDIKEAIKHFFIGIAEEIKVSE